MIGGIFHNIFHVVKEVTFALTPLLLAFFFFQVIWLRLPKKEVVKILKGFALTFLGLILFLQGVFIGFMPVGKFLGETLGAKSYNWILIPIGFILGFVVTFAEPAVRILNTEVEKVTSGYINSKIMLYTLSFGVAISVALSMLRIITGISLWYFIVPGYILAFILTRFVSKTFIGIAFDSGGVATGPMTVTFILTIAVGAATAIDGRDPLIDGFGMISLVALTPILSVLILGYLYNREERKSNANP